MKRSLLLCNICSRASFGRSDAVRIGGNVWISVSFRSSVAEQSRPSCCWKCGHERPGEAQFFCARCNTIQNVPESLNFYRLMGLEESVFDVDYRHLDQTYRTLQSKLHPDKFGLASEKEKSYSEEASSLINKAYNTLRSPLLRASYMLSHQGPGANDDEEMSTITDPEYLMEVMEARETIDAADEQTLRSLQSDYLQKDKECVEDMSKAFARGDYDGAKNLLIRLRYIRRILDAIQHKL